MNCDSKTSKKRRPKSRRKPHNAKAAGDYLSLADMVEAIASEKRKVPTCAGEVLMTRRERNLRLLVARALEGKVRELAQVLRIMIKYPDMAATLEIEIFIRGNMCDV